MINIKKPNKFWFTVLMGISFLIITEAFIWGRGSDFILHAVLYEPQGNLVITEAVLAGLVLIVMLLYGNSYVFTQKKENVFKGLGLGVFYIITSLFFMSTAISEHGFDNKYAVANLLLGCLFIGIAEEFLCRGWLLNEFLERFGKTKKGIWYSIIVSGLIFGLIHISNIFVMGQAVSATLTQVFSAAATGIVFGVIYYKTKNIWSVIILHGFWDFSIFTMELIPVTEATETINTFSVFGIVMTLIIAAVELLNIIPYVKDIEAKPDKGKIILWASVSFFAYIFALVLFSASTTMGDTYTFDHISIPEYSITQDNYSEYYINYSTTTSDTELTVDYYTFRLKRESDSELSLTNIKTNYKITIQGNNIYDYIIMEEKEQFILGIIDYIDSDNVYFKYVFIDKASINHSNAFLDNISANIKKHLISDISQFVILNDRDNNKSYLTAYSPDYGYYLLTGEDKISILEN